VLRSPTQRHRKALSRLTSGANFLNSSGTSCTVFSICAHNKRQAALFLFSFHWQELPWSFLGVADQACGCLTQVIDAGANAIVAGSAVFNAPDYAEGA
jgi:hypothetical protein